MWPQKRMTAFWAGCSTWLTENSTFNWSCRTLGNTFEKKVCSKSVRLIWGKNISVRILKTPAKQNITEKQRAIIRNMQQPTRWNKELHQAETDQVFDFDRGNITFATYALSDKSSNNISSNMHKPINNSSTPDCT